MGIADHCELVTLRDEQPFFEKLYTASPLTLVGTREPDGEPDLAPKHMAMPIGWEGQFGFVCTPRHATYRNAERTGGFTVSYPRPENILEATLAAGPREPDGSKPTLHSLETIQADEVDAPVVSDAYGVLECEVERIIDGFGDHELVVGMIVAKHIDPDAYRSTEIESETILADAPVLAFLYPDRFASISESRSFPFPVGYQS